jgi:hypothetical protein
MNRIKLGGLAALALLASLVCVAGPSATAVAATGTVTANVPVVRCPTSLGYVPSGPRIMLPRSRQVAVPAALADRLAVYTDSRGTMELVAPKGWNCTAVFGADGSGGVAVYPHGESLPASWGVSWRLARTSAVTAVVGSETSACYTCTLAQACPLFPAANATLRSYLGRQTCPARPAAEKVTPAGTGIVNFTDPAGTSGTGVPSGGRYPAAGVMTWHPKSSDGSWMETCTGPGDAECTVILKSFLAWYGKD